MSEKEYRHSRSSGSRRLSGSRSHSRGDSSRKRSDEKTGVSRTYSSSGSGSYSSAGGDSIRSGSQRAKSQRSDRGGISKSGNSKGRNSRRSSSSRNKSVSRRKNINSSIRKFLLVAVFALLALIVSSIIGNRRKKHELPFLDISPPPPKNGISGIRKFSVVGDKEFVFVINSEDLQNSDGFAVTNEPPLSVHETIVCATNSLPDYISADEIPDWFISSISLECHVGSKWFYVVNFKKKNGEINSDGSVKELSLPVLFEGRVVSGSGRTKSSKRDRDLDVAADIFGISTEDLLKRGEQSADVLLKCKDIKIYSNSGSQMFEFEITSDVLNASDPVDIYKSSSINFHNPVMAVMNNTHLYWSGKESESWQIISVSLNRWGLSDKWYYLVEYSDNIEAVRSGGRRFVFPVLINCVPVDGTPASAGL